MLRFLIFFEFLLIILITCQIRSNIGKLGKKLNFLHLFGMKLKKSAKNRKNEEDVWK